MTTVRFDADLWDAIGREAERLGVARSAYIRDAARERVARDGAAAQVRGELRAELAVLDDVRRRLTVVERAVKLVLIRRR